MNSRKQRLPPHPSNSSREFPPLLSDLSPFPPIPCALLNSLAAVFRPPVLCFQCFARSFSKTPGVGGMPTLPRRALLPPSYAPRGASISCDLSRLRILPVTTGVYTPPAPNSTQQDKPMRAKSSSRLIRSPRCQHRTATARQRCSLAGDRSSGLCPRHAAPRHVSSLNVRCTSPLSSRLTARIAPSHLTISACSRPILR